MIYSNVRELVEHQQYVFDTLWNKSIPSDEKIKAIEDGIQPQFIEIIRDSSEFQKLGLKLFFSAREEILVLVSTANAAYRTSKWFDVNLFKESVHKYGIKIRFLIPFSDWVKQQVQEWGEFVDIRYIPEELQTQITIAIYDRKSSLVVELKDDSKDSTLESVGLVTYSNSASTVASYVSIFETLWKQSGMYEESQNQLHSAEEELDRMKRYLNEALKEVSSFRKSRGSTSPQQVGSMVSEDRFRVEATSDNMVRYSHQIIHD
ncbi:MAG TPA: hypothetical protein VEL11_15790 [Candidatus Bathyarchaeia archaeon]|nr:hypothetical protein [Candidatus Bathyarchaeia archaeon]